MTDYLAIYGAVVSTATAVWNYQRSRGKVRVVLIFALEKVEGESQVGLGISVQNVSAQTVHLTNVSFLLPFRRMTLRRRIANTMRSKRILRTDGWAYSSLSLHSISDECPASIEPGKSHWIFVPDQLIREVLEGAIEPSIRAVASDALWRKTYSKTFDCSTFRRAKDGNGA